MKANAAVNPGPRAGEVIWSSAKTIARRVASLVEPTVLPEFEASGPSVQERIEELEQFTERYENFVAILCDSAQFGPNASLEDRYETVRADVVARYAALRPFLGAFLPPDDKEAFRFESGRPCDGFEKLFAAHKLHEFLYHDDGEMIFRIMKTREAVRLYGEHLRLLSLRVA